MTPLPMKQLDNLKWVYPLDSAGLEHDTTEYDSEDDARNAHRVYLAGKLAAKTNPAPSLAAQAAILKGRGNGYNT